MENDVCALPTREMLPDPLDITLPEDEADFAKASAAAKAEIGKVLEKPMLMAWYDGDSGKFSPHVTCCSENEPGWLIYAKSRGADVAVSVNSERYIFLYAEEAKAWKNMG